MPFYCRLLFILFFLYNFRSNFYTDSTNHAMKLNSIDILGNNSTKIHKNMEEKDKFARALPRGSLFKIYIFRESG